MRGAEGGARRPPWPDGLRRSWSARYAASGSPYRTKSVRTKWVPISRRPNCRSRSIAARAGPCTSSSRPSLREAIRTGRWSAASGCRRRARWPPTSGCRAGSWSRPMRSCSPRGISVPGRAREPSSPTARRRARRPPRRPSRHRWPSTSSRVPRTSPGSRGGRGCAPCARCCAHAPDARLGYPDPRGAPELRRAIAGHLRRVRGAVADPDAIVVCSGTAQALGPARSRAAASGWSSGDRRRGPVPAAPARHPAGTRCPHAAARGRPRRRARRRPAAGWLARSGHARAPGPAGRRSGTRAAAGAARVGGRRVEASSSRTTTTPSFATTARRSARCRGWRPSAWCTWARRARRLPRPCASAGCCCRSGWSSRSCRPRRSPITAAPPLTSSRSPA